MSGLEFLQYVGKLAGLTSKEAKERSLELLELVGINDAKNRRVGKYSGGMKQRLGIAQAIIHRPQLLLLDEPVSALDAFGRREVLELLEGLKKKQQSFSRLTFSMMQRKCVMRYYFYIMEKL